MTNCVLAIIKDEANLVMDFVIHHLDCGFDEIHIVDDGSSPPLAAVLSGLPKAQAAKVKIYRFEADFRHRTSMEAGQLYDEALWETFKASKQMYVYNYALKHIFNETNWVAFIDADEFLYLGRFNKINSLRKALEDAGHSAMVFDQMLFGHGFHISAPAQDNVCAYLWCADFDYGHGKFFARAADIEQIRTPHMPKLKGDATVANSDLSVRSEEFQRQVVQSVRNVDTPHLKHFIIQNVTACFERRLRPRIGSVAPMLPTTSAWTDRLAWLKMTSQRLNLQLAASLIALRIELGLPVNDYIQAMAEALTMAAHLDRTASEIDYDYLRGCMQSDNADNASLLFDYFKLPERNPHWLRFLMLPEDFQPERYQELNPDLRSLSRRRAIDHYGEHGRNGKRKYV